MAPKKRKATDESQRSLFSCGVSRPLKEKADTAEGQDSNRPSTDETIGTSENANVVEKEKVSISRHARRFQQRWVQMYKWLRYDEGTEMMTCHLCISAGRQNVFTRGCNNFKTSSFTDHIKSNDHQTALVSVDSGNSVHHLLKEQNKHHHVAKERAALAALRSVFWLSKEDIPLSKFKSFIEFQKGMGVDDLKALSVSPGVSYVSDYAAHEFLKALSDTLELDTKNALHNSPFVTVLTDESTDRTVTHRLVIYCKTINPETLQPTTQFVTNIQLDSGTGAAVAGAIISELGSRGVDVKKIMGLGTDGAAAMTGTGKGATGMMLRENPHIVNVHCVAHRLALCTSQAAENIPAMKVYQEVITSIYYYFKYSTSRVAKLKQVQCLLDSPQLKFKEVHSVRWMSFYAALEAVYRCLDPLLTYLAEAGTSDPKALGLKKKIGTLKFVSMTYILMDIIPIVSKLNLFFQKEFTDVALVKVQVDHTLKDLHQLMDTEGPYQQQLDNDITHERSQYKDHHITKCPQSDIVSVKQKFISNLIENIEKRFPDTDLLSAMGILSMRPVGFIESEEELDSWGNERLDVLLAHFGEPKTHTWTEEKETKSTTSPPVVDANEARREWKELKSVVKVQMYPRDSIITLWRLIAQFHSDMCPNLIKLACMALICPVNTAGCERGFSAQNQILSAQRNRLTPETQEMLLRVKINGPGYDSFDFDKALFTWKSSTARKMFCCD